MRLMFSVSGLRFRENADFSHDPWPTLLAGPISAEILISSDNDVPVSLLGEEWRTGERV